MQEHPVGAACSGHERTRLQPALLPGMLGIPDHAKRFGLYAHTHLAVTPDKLALGVVGGHQFFDRALETLGQSDERVPWPIEQKESFRWLEGFRLARQLAAELPATPIVSVADREADLYDIFVEAQQQSGPRAEYIIRAKASAERSETQPRRGRSCVLQSAG